MKHDHPDYHKPEDRPVWWKTSSGWAFIFFIFAAGYFLFKEHSAHLVPYLPWLIILLCPFIHIFLHRGHGHGAQSHGDTNHREGE